MPPKPAKKRVQAVVKLQINAGAATPAPPVGSALGPHGLNIMDFCKQFNAQTASQPGHGDPGGRDGLSRPVVHVHHQDAAGGGAAAQGSRASRRARRRPTGEKVGTVTRAQVKKIAELKMPDLNAMDLERRDGDGRRHRALDGHRGDGLMADPRASSTARSWSGRDPLQRFQPREALEHVKTVGLREVRRDGGHRGAPGRRPAARRPDRPRHRGAAARDRQEGPGAGDHPGRQGEGSGGGGRRLRRASSTSRRSRTAGSTWTRSSRRPT